MNKEEDELFHLQMLGNALRSVIHELSMLRMSKKSRKKVFEGIAKLVEGLAGSD